MRGYNSMHWNDKSVLITGAGGFVGSHLTEKLVDTGARVRAFVRYNSRNDWGMLRLLPKQKLDEIEVFAGDLRDSQAIRRAFQKREIVFHLGSLIAIPYSYMHPRDTIETNVIGALNVMSAAKEAGVERVIHTSTSEVYGTAIYVPMDEKHPLQGQSPYSASKIGADMVAESFHRSFGLPVSIIRPFNTFGPRQSARAVIPTIIIQALAATPRISLGSLFPTRDYTYVNDLVSAFIKIAESGDSVGEVINIGSGSEISIGDIAKKVLSILSIDKPVILDDKRVRPEKSEVERLYCDNTKAKRLLGWEPETPFEVGLQKTIQWISENMDSYKADLYNV
jgi:NAD dependent epimerase/dehydratase